MMRYEVGQREKNSGEIFEKVKYVETISTHNHDTMRDYIVKFRMVDGRACCSAFSSTPSLPP